MPPRIAKRGQHLCFFYRRGRGEPFRVTEIATNGSDARLNSRRPPIVDSMVTPLRLRVVPWEDAAIDANLSDVVRVAICENKRDSAFGKRQSRFGMVFLAIAVNDAHAAYSA
jgi:hypothetical protein